MASSDPHTEEEQLVFKVEDGDGKVVGGCVVDIHPWGRAVLAQLWVEESYRRRGIGSRLFGEIEREAKEKGACVILSHCCDWVSGFFFQNRFTPRGKLEDYPKGHTAYELEKRI